MPARRNWDGRERRKFPRFQSALKVDMFFKGLKHAASDKTLNISEGGMFVATNHHAKKGEKVHVRVIIKDEDAFFNVMGKVIWVSSGKKYPKGLGIEFMGLSEDDKVILERYLRKYKEDDTLLEDR